MDRYKNEVLPAPGKPRQIPDIAEEVDSDKEEEMDVKDNLKEEDEERRGVKRSVKERLGEKRVKMDRYKNEVLPAPGKPRQIPDIAEESLLEGTDEEFAEEL